MYIQLITNVCICTIDYKLLWMHKSKVRDSNNSWVRAMNFFVHFSLSLFTLSQRVTIFFFYDNVVFASFLVNTDSETAVVNVTYATREEAKTWVDLGLFLFKCFRTVVFEFYRVLYLYICFCLKKKNADLWHVSGTPGHLY